MKQFSGFLINPGFSRPHFRFYCAGLQFGAVAQLSSGTNWDAALARYIQEAVNRQDSANNIQEVSLADFWKKVDFRKWPVKPSLLFHLFMIHLHFQLFDRSIHHWDINGYNAGLRKAERHIEPITLQQIFF